MLAQSPSLISTRENFSPCRLLSDARLEGSRRQQVLIPNFQKRNFYNLGNSKFPKTQSSQSWKFQKTNPTPFDFTITGTKAILLFFSLFAGAMEIAFQLLIRRLPKISPRKSLTTRSSVRLPSVMAFAKDLFKRGAGEWMVDQVLCPGCLPPRVCRFIFYHQSVCRLIFCPYISL